MDDPSRPPGFVALGHPGSERDAGLETFPNPRIRGDVAAVLELPSDKVRVTLTQKSRGGISITATS